MTARKKPFTRRRSLLAVELLESRDLLSAGFTNGDIVVERVGTGSSAPSSAAQAIFADEYPTTLAQGQATPALSVALPTTTVGANQGITEDGAFAATGAAFMQDSADGHLLTLSGYSAAVGTASETGTSGNRIVATINDVGTVNTTTQISNAYTANNIRAAATLDDQGFWTAGAGGATGGIEYVKLGATTATPVATTTFTTFSDVVVANNQLYGDAHTVGTTAAATLTEPGTIGVGVPNQTLAQEALELPGLPTGNDSSGNPPLPYQFTFENPTTLYVADGRTDGFGGIQKYTLSNGTWSLAYSSQVSFTNTANTNITNDGLWGLVGYGLNGGGQYVLYGSTIESVASNYIVQITDTGSGFTFAEVAQAKTNEGFRGMALAPTGAAATGTANTVATASSTLLVQSSAANPAAAGTSITFTGTVLPGSGATATPTGTVTFYASSAPFPSGGSVVPIPGVTATVNPQANGTGTFSLTTSALSGLGSYSIYAVYSGDTNFLATSTTGPVITSLANTNFVSSGINTYQVTATTIATNTVTYSLANQPGWLSMTPQGLLEGTPPLVAQATSVTCTITATDNTTGISAVQVFTVYISPARVSPVPFTPGDLLVYQAGDGATTYGLQGSGGDTANVGALALLDEYTPTGTLVQSMYLPNVTNPSTLVTNPLLVSINGTSDGKLTTSADGRLVTFTGYNAPAGTGAIDSSTVPRVIGTINGDGQTTTTIVNAFSGATLRSATTVNGTQYWAAGSAGGVEYFNSAEGSPTGIEVNVTANSRAVGIDDGTLYWTTATGAALGIDEESVALPTTPGTDIHVGAGAGGSSPYQFVIINLDGGSTLDSSSLLYVVDDDTTAAGGGLYRFSYNGTSWNSVGNRLTTNNIVPNIAASQTTQGLTGTLENIGGVPTPVLYSTYSTASIAATTSYETGILEYIDSSPTTTPPQPPTQDWSQLPTPIGFTDPGSYTSPVVQFKGVAIVPQLPGSTIPNLTLSSVPAGPNVVSTQALVVTASLLPQTGWVSFMNGTTTLATVPIVNGTATYTIPGGTLTAGSQTVTVFYGGNNTYNQSTSAITFTVVPYTTSMSLFGNANPPKVGTNVNLTVTLVATGAANPTGTVTFTDNAIPLGSTTTITQVAPDTYRATLTVPTSATQVGGALTPGIHVITAVYSGDTNFVSNSAVVTQAVDANPFGSGDLLVYRTGDGANSLNYLYGGNAVYVDEYTTAPGQTGPVQSIAFPTADSGASHALVSTSDDTTVVPAGQLSLSGDGTSVFVVGYDAAPSTLADLDTSSAALIPRTIGRISYDGTVDTGVALSDLSSGGAVQGVYSPNSSAFYATGVNGEVRYVSSYTDSPGTQTSTQIDTGVSGTPVSLDQIGDFGGQLYVSSSSGGVLKIGTVGTGTPTTVGQNITPLPGLPFSAFSAPADPVGFYLTKLNSASTGMDTLYIADAGSGFFGGTITKWSLVSGSWVLSDTITAGGSPTGFDDMQGQTIGTTVKLYLSYGFGGYGDSGGGSLFVLNDSGGYNHAISSHVLITLATLSTVSNENFRGVAFVPEAPATHFAITGAPTSAIAGVVDTITVTALNAYNQIVTNYSGTVHFTSTDANAVLPPDATLAAGVGAFNVTLKTVGGQTITATDKSSSSIQGTAAVAVTSGQVFHFAVTAPASASAGTSVTVTVTVQDQFFNTLTSYNGTVHFTSSDPSAVLPADSTLTNGTGTFTVTFQTGGNQTITASDTVATSGITGRSSAIAVSAAATHFSVSAATSAVAGNVFVFTVTARDAGNNIAAGYSGVVGITSSDPQAALPANATLSNGVGFFAAMLRTAGNDTVIATDTVNGGIKGTSAAISVTAIAASHFSVSAPASAVTGIPFGITVTALDPFNNTATSYGGTFQFTSTDSLGTFPVSGTLTFGQGVFPAITLKSPGNQTITVTDTVSGITGTSNTIVTRGLTVASLTPTPSGFTATFDKPFVPSDINLYDSASGGGVDDVLLSGPARRRFLSTAR